MKNQEYWDLVFGKDLGGHSLVSGGLYALVEAAQAKSEIQWGAGLSPLKASSGLAVVCLTKDR